jgi:uroporphyrin-III C-methyltransferase / precorrin-2 dehydrogenase / sirohydrochlorin ferrochelatase
MKTTQTPKVILAGAGPGGVGLITVKASKYLEKADFILVDRLVNPEILQLYASPTAEIVYVGKHGGKESISQEAINTLLIEYGQRDGLTVRLKGGDVAFFSNVLSEIEALVANHIPFEVVPGITAASGASASLKMPLTAREFSRGVRFLTYQDGDHFTDGDWQNMSTTTDTLVFYMSGRTLPELVNRLKQYAQADKPLAVIEQATTPNQRVLASSLFLFDVEFANTTINQPALVVIGEITRLANTEQQAKQDTLLFFKEH